MYIHALDISKMVLCEMKKERKGKERKKGRKEERKKERKLNEIMKASTKKRKKEMAVCKMCQHEKNLSTKWEKNSARPSKFVSLLQLLLQEQC